MTAAALVWVLIMQCHPINGSTQPYDGHAHAFGGFATRQECEAKATLLNRVRPSSRDDFICPARCEYTG
jgi:hypothetical protein